jgi:integrase
LKRIKTKYPGVFYREAKRIGGRGSEKVYYVVYKKGGKVFEEKAGRQFADDMTPARAARIRSELIEGKRLTRKQKKAEEEAKKAAEQASWTVDRLWEQYKNSRPPGKALKVDTYRYEKHLKRPFGKKEPKGIIPLDAERLKRRLLRKLSPQTVAHVLNLLTWIVNYGVKNGYCAPLHFKIQKPTVDNIKTEDLTPDQLTSLVDAIEKDTNVQATNFMKMVLFTGLRRGSLFKLMWSDVDFHRGVINIVGKGGRREKVPLNDAAREVLNAHPRSDSPFVFPGRGGRQRVTIQQAARKIRDDAGLPRDFRPLHGLRHVYASMLASSGKVDMYTLQKLLTHKTPEMTQRYAHLRDEALKRASGLAGDLINEAVKAKTEEKAVDLDRHKNRKP